MRYRKPNPIGTFFASLGVAGIIAYFCLVFGLILGWVVNLFKTFFTIKDALVTDAFTAELVLRLLGVPLVPLGGVMGWI